MENTFFKRKNDATDQPAKRAKPKQVKFNSGLNQTFEYGMQSPRPSIIDLRTSFINTNESAAPVPANDIDKIMDNFLKEVDEIAAQMSKRL